MFTGLIENIQYYKIFEKQLIFENNNDYWSDVVLGDSIAVNGVCLTISKINKFITFDLLDETISITNLTKTNIANLEKALSYGKHLGGHVISGHIFELGTIKNINNNIFTIQVSNPNYLILKDSITINGVSLTIQQIQDNLFDVHIIPHTLNHTTFKLLQINDPVNIEYNIQNFNDEYFMNIALNESLKGKYTTAPNPTVGCVLVKNNKIINTGYHVKYGSSHAEINALKDVSEDNLTMYVTLEPCCHFGKTGPCSNFIVNSGLIKKVVIGIMDPDSKVSGKGIQYLRDHNIEVVIGVLEDSISQSLKSYIHSRQTGRPYLISKIALSFEGNYCLPEQNIEITSKEEQLKYHTLRAESQCIMIGSKTALIDNPLLTVRNGLNVKQPLRVIIDSKGIVKNLNLMSHDTLIFTSEASDDTLRYWDNFGVEWIYLNHITPDEVLTSLSKRGIIQCLLEGGGELQKVFEDYIDELVIIQSDVSIPNGKKWLVDQSKFKDNKRILSNFDFALERFKTGMVIVMDDINRENEGDIIINAEIITEEMITFMKRYTTGIICVTLTEKRALELGLDIMVFNNSDPHKTAFTITCDSKECTTGVSSKDRLLTIKTILSGTSDQLSKPGHIFPLIAKAGGLSERRGHTEASIDLCKLIGLPEVAVICELTNDDGTMMRLNDIILFGKKFNIPIITTEQIYQNSYYHVMKDDPVIKLEASCELTTRDYGIWKLLSYRCINGIIKVLQKMDNAEKPMVRIHSECFTGDVLNSSHCDCGSQLSKSMEMIHKNGNGLIIYPCNHEGRGIGFTNKVKVYDIMNKDKTINTYEANKMIGYEEDLRDYSYCVSILRDLDYKSFTLLTTNPLKIKALSEFNISVIGLECGGLPFNERYLTDKAKKHGSFKSTNRSISHNKKIGIVHSGWYLDLIDPYVKSIKESVSIEMVRCVPGSFEIPLAVQQMCDECDIIVCIGAIIKGETYHFEVLSQTVCDSLMNIQLKTGKVVLNYVLNCYTIEQVKARLSDSSVVIETIKHYL